MKNYPVGKEFMFPHEDITYVVVWNKKKNVVMSNGSSSEHFNKFLYEEMGYLFYVEKKYSGIS